MIQQQHHLQLVKKRITHAGFFDSVGWRAILDRLIIPIGKLSADPAALFRGRVVSRTDRSALVRNRSGEVRDHDFARGRWEVLIP